MSHMADSKAPSMDDFPYEFYKACWGFFGNDLLLVYK